MARIGDEPQKKWSRLSRAAFVIAAWTITALACPHIFEAALDFPLGCAVLLSRGKVFLQGGLGLATVIIGWAFYLGITVAVILTRKRMAAIVLYIILCVVLALNVTGCHLMLAEPDLYF